MKKEIHIRYLLLDILYPRRCPVCHRILKDKKTLVCRECADVLRPVSVDYCLKCGRPVRGEEEYCEDCRNRKRDFDQGRGIFLYDERMKKSLVRYKYYGNREYADYYAAAVCRYGAGDIRRWTPDVIIPVPLYRRKMRMRGFNQAGYLAQRIGALMDIPVSENTLVKIKNTRSQKKLNAAQRKTNLARAFQTKGSLEGLIILVVDDVYTTGSTMEAAAASLKTAGARKVYFITLCMGNG